MQMSKCILNTLYTPSILQVHFDQVYICILNPNTSSILQGYFKYTSGECLKYTSSMLGVYFKVYSKYTSSISLFRKGLLKRVTSKSELKFSPKEKALNRLRTSLQNTITNEEWILKAKGKMESCTSAFSDSVCHWSERKVGRHMHVGKDSAREGPCSSTQTL